MPRRAWIDAELHLAARDDIRLDELSAAITELRGHRKGLSPGMRAGFDIALGFLIARRRTLRRPRA